MQLHNYFAKNSAQKKHLFSLPRRIQVLGYFSNYFEIGPLENVHFTVTCNTVKDSNLKKINLIV